MKTGLSRRHLAFLLPALAASAQESSNRHLPSAALEFDKLPTKLNTTNQSRSHAVLDGETHSGFPVEVHVTELPPGASPHAPHQHVHEEMFLVQSGIIETTVNGKTTKLSAGSVFYVNSGELHGIRNPGPGRCEYFVVALGAKA